MKKHTFFALLFISKNLPAQISDTLPMAIISETRTQFFAAGQKNTTLDSTTFASQPGGSMTQILAQNFPIYLKSYGAAALTTLSVRGAGAHQTAILWNGFDLRSSMNGLADLNLLGLAAADEITLRPGAPVAISGSGALGGTLEIGTKTARRDGFHGNFSAGLGSWNEQNGAGHFSFKNKKFAVGLRAWAAGAENNYPVRGGTSSGSPVLENAKSKSWGVLPELKFFISEKQSVEAFFWHQKSDRQIPPSRTSANNFAHQLDDFQRLALVWAVSFSKNWLSKTRVFAGREHIFFESETEENASSTAFQTSAETEFQRDFKKFGAINFGLHARRDVAKLPDLAENKNRKRAAIWSAWRKKGSRGRVISLAARQEMVDEKLVPFTFSGGLENGIGKNILGKFSVARNFNLPTFNDLFWPTLGNPNLRPESGWSSEIGLVFFAKNLMKKPFGASGFSAELTHFQTFTKDWIKWRPGADGLFRPENLLSVWSRGGEVSLRWARHFSKKFQLKISGEYAFILATRQDVAEPKQVGKQLEYLPKKQLAGSLDFSWPTGGLRFSQRLNSQRHTDPTNNSDYDLPGFAVADFSVSQRVPFVPGLVFRAGIFNFFNKNYEMIAFRPMPPRSWRVDFRMSF